VEDVQVFSKLDTGTFPSLEAVADVVDRASRGEKVVAVDDTQAISFNWTSCCQLS